VTISLLNGKPLTSLAPVSLPYPEHRVSQLAANCNANCNGLYSQASSKKQRAAAGSSSNERQQQKEQLSGMLLPVIQMRIRNTFLHAQQP